MTKEEVQAAAAAVPFWWHSIELGHGVVTPGMVPVWRQQQMLGSMGLPDLSGKSVLDIGAWDGGFSFAAEQRNAARVVALDHFVWEHDMAAMIAHKRHKNLDSVNIEAFHRPNEMPGRVPFDTARKILNSRVEPVVGNFSTMDLKPLGKFDVVFFLGVLYHLENPLAALRRLREVTSGVAIIETEAVVIDRYEHVALCEFFPGSELNNDPSNWWSPNARALTGLCEAAGFTRVEVVDGPPKGGVRARLRRAGKRVLRAAKFEPSLPRRYRAIVRCSG